MAGMMIVFAAGAAAGFLLSLITLMAVVEYVCANQGDE